MLVLYEVSTEPRSAFCNALEIINIDSRREVYLIDILNYIKREELGVGYHYAFYVVIQDRLVWLDSPTCLVPPCSDGIIRMVFKPSSLPPFIHMKQYMDFADKSRMQMYSRDDYEQTSGFAHKTFHEAARKASQAPRIASQRSAPAQHQQAAPAGHPFSSSSVQRNSASQNSFFSADFSSSEKYSDDQRFDEFEAFDAKFAPTPSHTERAQAPQQQQQRPPRQQQQQEAPRRRESQQSEYRDAPSRYEDRYSDRYEDDHHHNTSGHASSKYNLDHPKSSNPGHLPRRNSGHKNANENNLNSIVGEDTAAVINDAAEAVGAAAKNFWGFASNLGKSVIDMANTASVNVQNASASVVNSGPPGKLYPGMVVQVRFDFVVTVLCTSKVGSIKIWTLF